MRSVYRRPAYLDAPVTPRQCRTHEPAKPLDAIARPGRGVDRVLAPGEPLFRQSDPATAIFKVEGDRICLIRRTVDDHLVVLHTAHSGDFLAEAPLFSEAYHSDAVALVASHVRTARRSNCWRNSAPIPVWRRRSWQGSHAGSGPARCLELRDIRSARERLLHYLRLRLGPNSGTVICEEGDVPGHKRPNRSDPRGTALSHLSLSCRRIAYLKHEAWGLDFLKKLTLT